MSNIPTPHITAEKNMIAKTVLMPGDPLRAQFIAENYLENSVCFNTVRNMFGYTGTYKGQEISVMGSGMGMPSIGIYSFELFNFYDVENIVRIGSAGAFQDYLTVNDVILASSASTDSNYQSQYNLKGTFAPTADFTLLKNTYDTAVEMGLNVYVGNTLSSDIFYNADETSNDKWKGMNVLAVEMEAAALYMNASKCGKKALCILTVSDHLYKNQSLSAEMRQTSFDKMMTLALDSALTY